MRKTFDSSFIERLKKGDQQAIAHWYDQSAPVLLGVCMRYCQSTQDAEDLLHNGLLKVLGVISSFKYQGPGGFEAWVKRIMVNTALTQLREQAKKTAVRFDDARFSVSEDEDDSEELPPRPDPEELVEWIRELPLGYRTVLNMYVFEGYSHREIAAELNISDNTSKSQLSKARAMLRRKAFVELNELERKGNG
jgi:RNA polymerase sigma-70 factor (ECF subfamily)